MVCGSPWEFKGLRKRLRLSRRLPEAFELSPAAAELPWVWAAGWTGGKSLLQPGEASLRVGQRQGAAVAADAPGLQTITTLWSSCWARGPLSRLLRGVTHGLYPHLLPALHLGAGWPADPGERCSEGMQPPSPSCPGLAGGVHVPLWIGPLLARARLRLRVARPARGRVLGPNKRGDGGRPAGGRSSAGGRAAEPGLRGRGRRVGSSGIARVPGASVHGLRDQVPGADAGADAGGPGLPEARKARTHLRHRDAPPGARPGDTHSQLSGSQRRALPGNGARPRASGVPRVASARHRGAWPAATPAPAPPSLAPCGAAACRGLRTGCAASGTQPATWPAFLPSPPYK